MTEGEAALAAGRRGLGGVPRLPPARDSLSGSPLPSLLSRANPASTLALRLQTVPEQGGRGPRGWCPAAGREQAPRPLLAAVCDLCFCCSGAWGGACRLWAVLLAVWGNLSLVLLLGVFVCRPARLLVHVTCLPPPVQEPPSLGSWSRVQDAGGSLSWLQVQGQPLSSGPLPSPTRSSTFLSRGLVLVRATWARHPQETPWRVGRAAAPVPSPLRPCCAAQSSRLCSHCSPRTQSQCSVPGPWGCPLGRSPCRFLHPVSCVHCTGGGGALLGGLQLCS